jgi:glycosyltransferase involved in cell wall biosynthesis
MEKLFKVGINARPFAQKSMRGLSRHTYELITELHQLDSTLEFYLYTYGAVDSYYKEKLPFVHWRETKVSPKILWDLIVLPASLKKDGIQLFHSTNNLGIPFGTKIKKILTIHDDITHLHRVQLTSKNIWGFLNYQLELLLLKCSDFFITISEASKKNIVKNMNIPERKIAVIYNGSNVSLLSIENNSKPVRDDFYLYVGGLEKRKNIILMIHALEMAQEKLKTELKLILVSKFSSAENDVAEAIKNSKIKIEIREDISDGELSDLYRRARCSINPSLDEGFGLPIAEAMQNETPLLISDISVFREVSGEHAFFFNPKKKEELSSLIEDLEKNKISFDQHTNSAKNYSEKYQWSTMAKETLDLYKKVLKDIK